MLKVQMSKEKWSFMDTNKILKLMFSICGLFGFSTCIIRLSPVEEYISST